MVVKPLGLAAAPGVPLLLAVELAPALTVEVPLELVVAVSEEDEVVELALF